MDVRTANLDFPSLAVHHEEAQKKEEENLKLIKTEVTIWTDIRSFILILIFYFNQGVLGGYISVLEVRLTELNATNDELNFFSYYGLPYSLKFLIAPFIDTYYLKNFGKRKTFVVPCYYFSGLVLVISSFYMDSLVAKKDIASLFSISLTLTILICIKDLSVDGWNVKMLHEENISYAGFCQLFGQTIGVLVGYNFFIWSNSVEYSNKYFWSSPRDYPIITHQIFMMGIAAFYIAIAIFVHCCVKESPEKGGDEVSFKETFKRIKGMCYNKNLRKYLIFIIILSGGVNTMNSIGGTVLIRDKGFNIERLSLILLICTPVSMIFMVIGSICSKKRQDLSVTIVSVYLLIPLQILYFFLVFNYDKNNEGNFIYYMALCYIFIYFIIDMEFVASSSFAFRITESKFGATILTFINTVGNFSNFWPRTLSLALYNHLSYWEIFLGSVVYQIVICVLLMKPFTELEQVPKEEWDPVFVQPSDNEQTN